MVEELDRPTLDLEGLQKGQAMYCVVLGMLHGEITGYWQAVNGPTQSVQIVAIC